MSDLFSRVKEIATLDVVTAFLPDLELKQDGSGRHKTLCPFHAEDTPSFTVFQDGFKCFGCDAHGSNVDLLLKAGLASKPLDAAKMIAERFGIEVEEKKPTKQKALTLSSYVSYVNLPEDFLVKTFHPRETAKGLEMPYLNERKEEVATRLRTRLKAKEGSRWPKGTTPTLYGLWGLEKMKKAGNVLLVEGESDTQVCWFNKTPALGVPGATTFKKEWASLLLPFSLIAIIQEPGPAGEGFVKSICAALKGASYQGTVKAASLSEKDPRDLWLKNGERFKEELEAAVARSSVIDLYPAIPLTRDLIFKIRGLLKRHVFFKDHRLPLLIAVWVLGTYVYDLFIFFGYLWINSPVKRCGKSRLADILSQFCHNPTPRLSNISEASIFRLADFGHTLILDELENLRGEDREKYGMVMTILNNGFQAGGKVPRVEKGEGGFQVVYFNTYCPKVLAGINRLVDTIEDRSFKIQLVRKTKQERVERFNLRKQAKDLEAVREELKLWAEERKADIETVYDSIDEVKALESLDDRLQDIAEPLVSIATYADAETANGQERILPELISLLLDMAGKRSEGERREAIGAFTLLAEEILGREPEKFIPSTQLLDKVKEVDELSWVASTRSLGTFLRKFDLSHTKRRGPEGKQVRGYVLERDWIEEAKNRYLSSSPESNLSHVSLNRSQSGSEGNFECVPGNSEGHIENEPQTRARTGRGT